MFSAISVAALIDPPMSELSPPDSAFDTASLSSITTSRSNGVNCPTVRRPETRTSSINMQNTNAARSTSSHHGTLSSNMANLLLSNLDAIL